MGSLTAKRNMKKKELNEVSLGEPIHYGMDVYGDGIPDDFWSAFLCYDGTAFSIRDFKDPNGVRYIVKVEYPKLSEVLADEKMTREVLNTCDYYNLEKDQPEQINYGDIMRTFPNTEAITLEEYENLRAIIDGRPPKNQSSNKQPTKGSLKDFMKKKELNEEIGNDSKVTWADFDVLSPKIFRDGGSYYHTYYWECYDGVAFGFKRQPDDNGPEYLKMTYPKLAEVLSDEEMKKNVLNVHYENYDDMDEDKVDYADVMIALWDPKNIEISNGKEMKNRKKISLGYAPQKGSLRNFLKKKELNEETSNYETEVGFVDKRFFGNSKPRVYDVICYDGHATGKFNLEATEGSNSYTGGYENSPKEITITYPKLSEISADEELKERIEGFMEDRYGGDWAGTENITYGDVMYCFGKVEGNNLNRPESGSLRKFLKTKLNENDDYNDGCIVEVYSETAFNDDEDHFYSWTCYDGIAFGKKCNEDEDIPEYVKVTYPTLKEILADKTLKKEVLDTWMVRDYDLEEEEINGYDEIMVALWSNVQVSSKEEADLYRTSHSSFNRPESGSLRKFLKKKLDESGLKGGLRSQINYVLQYNEAKKLIDGKTVGEVTELMRNDENFPDKKPDTRITREERLVAIKYKNIGVVGKLFMNDGQRYDFCKCDIKDAIIKLSPGYIKYKDNGRIASICTTSMFENKGLKGGLRNRMQSYQNLPEYYKDYFELKNLLTGVTFEDVKRMLKTEHPFSVVDSSFDSDCACLVLDFKNINVEVFFRGDLKTATAELCRTFEAYENGECIGWKRIKNGEKLLREGLKRGLKSEMQCYRDYGEVQRMLNGKTLEEVKEILKNGNFMLCNQFNEYDINEKRTIVIDANYKSITFTVKIDPDTNFAKVTPDFECYDENDQYIGVRVVNESSLKGGLRAELDLRKEDFYGDYYEIKHLLQGRTIEEIRQMSRDHIFDISEEGTDHDVPYVEIDYKNIMVDFFFNTDRAEIAPNFKTFKGGEYLGEKDVKVKAKLPECYKIYFELKELLKGLTIKQVQELDRKGILIITDDIAEIGKNHYCLNIEYKGKIVVNVFFKGNPDIATANLSKDFDAYYCGKYLGRLDANKNEEENLNLLREAINEEDPWDKYEKWNKEHGVNWDNYHDEYIGKKSYNMNSPEYKGEFDRGLRSEDDDEADADTEREIGYYESLPDRGRHPSEHIPDYDERLANRRLGKTLPDDKLGKKKPGEVLDKYKIKKKNEEKNFLSTFTKEDAWDIIIHRTKMNFSPGEYNCNFTSPKLCVTSEELDKLRDRYDFDRRAYILTANKDFCDGHFRVQVTYDGRSNNAHCRETIRKEDNDFHFNMNRVNDYWGWIMVDADMLREIRNRNSLFGA